MDIFSRFESVLQGVKNGNEDEIQKFLADVVVGEINLDQRKILSSQISQIFFELNIRNRTEFLYFLGRIDPNCASLLAKQDINDAYEKVRLHAGYLHQILISIDNMEPFVGGLSTMEVEKALALAFNYLKARRIQI